MENAEDLNRLIRELNSGRGDSEFPDMQQGFAVAPEAEPPRVPATLAAWLSALQARGGSNLLLASGAPPAVRCDGRLEFLAEQPLTGPDIERAVIPAIPAAARERYRHRFAADASLRLAGRRFRVNLHRERGRAAAAIRALPSEPPALSALGLPDAISRIVDLPRGLVLIAGPTGSGKTTTLAALVSEINRTQARHILTIEDPIEFEHAHARSVVEQVEIGVDALDFASALRSAMRQAPDVLVIGEMRDPETMTIALAAAETGHLVLSTVHASDAAGAIARLADSFPPERQNTVRQEIAMSLAAIVTQHLLPRANGRGRCAAAEVFLATYGARQHIRKNALQHLHQEIALSRRVGAVSMEESLARLARAETVTPEEARARAHHLEEFESYLRG